MTSSLHCVTLADGVTVARAQPGPEDIGLLAAHGFRAIVNLRAAGEAGEIMSPQQEGEAAARHGLRYAHLPVSPDELTADSMNRFEREIGRLPRPVLVHCASGRRAGLLTLAHVARSEGLSSDAAAAKARDCGFSFDSADLKRVLAEPAGRSREPRQ